MQNINTKATMIDHDPLLKLRKARRSSFSLFLS
jgi:hypothetical protein